MKVNRFLIIAAVLVGGFAVSLTACATREIPYPALEAKYGLPSSNYMELEDGVRVHYTDEGPKSAPTVVLVHGFAASVHAWRPWIDRLSGDYRMVAMDLPGHGLTSAPTGYRGSGDKQLAIVDELVERLGIERFVIAGNSMGGGVAWTYTLSHPEKVAGLVLVNAAGWPGERSEEDGGPPFVFMLLGNPVGRAVLKSFNPRMFAEGGLKSAYLDESLVTDELMDRYAELALAPGHRDVLLTSERGSRRYTREDFARITAPTLALVGEQDKVIPSKMTKEMAQAIPGATLVVYEDGGHVPMEQLPDRSAADLKAFLLRVFPPASAAPTSPDASPAPVAGGN
ncbi:alpha/beta fold hydrolase [bacterium]|nr:alpha/beta fold hydrolase [bacterium]